MDRRLQAIQPIQTGALNMKAKHCSYCGGPHYIVRSCPGCGALNEFTVILTNKPGVVIQYKGLAPLVYEPNSFVAISDSVSVLKELYEN